MSTAGFRLRYLAKAAAGVPRDLVNGFIRQQRFTPSDRPSSSTTATFVCDARSEMCNN
jgi:hypothetical protein